MTNVEKKENKRWGPEFIDGRDWPKYNEQLVRRGEVLLDVNWVNGWDEELRQMNDGKVGRPYKFPNSLIRMQATWHNQKLPYRMIEGLTRRLYDLSNLPAYNDYSTVNRRLNKLNIQLDLPVGPNAVLFADGTGFQAIEGGEYLRVKYGKKNRQWIQVIILGDSNTKEPVSFEVKLKLGSEPDSAERQMDELMSQGVKIGAFGGDGAFDKISLWNYLEDNSIRPIIKPAKNARVDSDSEWRNQNAKYRREHGYGAWSKAVGYGARWPATEGIFSAIKRMFGEELVGKSPIGMLQEAKMKVLAYTMMKRYGEA
jgi:DDE family transposase